MRRILFLISVLLLASIRANEIEDELLVTKDYTEYLRKTVDWEVEDYDSNIFRGWTIEDARLFLGLRDFDPDDETAWDEFDQPPETPKPAMLSWMNAACDHGPQNQGQCGSCWAFAAVGMLSDRCCLHSKDQGWLSPQELVSCDKGSGGCNGGSLESPLKYFQTYGGLVPETCYPYKAKDEPCPMRCVDGHDWRSAHVCKCTTPYNCRGTAGITACLQSGPVPIGFYVCRSLMSYRSGVYKCDCTKYIGAHAVLVMGYSTTQGCAYFAKNSWGPQWGTKGYFQISCETCRLSGAPVCGKVNA